MKMRGGLEPLSILNWRAGVGGPGGCTLQYPQTAHEQIILVSL